MIFELSDIELAFEYSSESEGESNAYISLG